MRANPLKQTVIGGLYAVTLISSAALFMYIALVGGNPYHAGPAITLDLRGVQSSVFRRGDWVYVMREVCLDKDLFAEHSPSLYDVARHAYIALPTTTTVGRAGCAMRSMAFQIPYDLPPGDYEYRNVSRFQNNLVGRDESNVYPPTRIKVVP